MVQFTPSGSLAYMGTVIYYGSLFFAVTGTDYGSLVCLGAIVTTGSNTFRRYCLGSSGSLSFSLDTFDPIGITSVHRYKLTGLVHSSTSVLFLHSAHLVIIDTVFPLGSLSLT